MTFETWMELSISMMPPLPSGSASRVSSPHVDLLNDQPVLLVVDPEDLPVFPLSFPSLPLPGHFSLRDTPFP
jgi:hypothetical protein